MKPIFFVEDDLSLINSLSFALKKQGYAVEVARTKQEAESLWLKAEFDLSFWTFRCPMVRQIKSKVEF